MSGVVGHLGAEAQRDALVRLDADGEQVGLNLLAGAARRHAVEDQQRRLLELDADLRGPLLQPLARAQIKRNPGPAPVFDLQPHRGIGLRARLGIDALFVAIAHHMLASTMPGPYWPRTAFRIGSGNGPPHLHFFAPHGLGLKARWRLHGHKAQQLHHVVLHHVAQRAGLLVERPAAFHAQRLGGRDLHMVDVIPVPDRLKDAVGKAENQNVLYRLFAQVVVDAEDLVLVEDGVHLLVELARRVESWPNGFSMTTATRPAPAAPSLRAQVLDDPGKVLRRRGQIEKTVRRCPFPWRCGRARPSDPRNRGGSSKFSGK